MVHTVPTVHVSLYTFSPLTQSTADIPGFIRRRSADVGADLQLRAHYLGEVRGMMMVRDMLAKTMDPFGENVWTCTYVLVRMRGHVRTYS